jgi:hypothetical protein
MGIYVIIVDAGMPQDGMDFRLLLVGGKHTTEDRRNHENKAKDCLLPGVLVI